MSDMVEMLQNWVELEELDGKDQHLVARAADEIESLRAELSKCRCDDLVADDYLPNGMVVFAETEDHQKTERWIAEKDKRIEELEAYRTASGVTVLLHRIEELEKELWVERARADQPIDGKIITLDQISKAWDYLEGVKRSGKTPAEPHRTHYSTYAAGMTKCLELLNIHSCEGCGGSGYIDVDTGNPQDCAGCQCPDCAEWGSHGFVIKEKS